MTGALSATGAALGGAGRCDEAIDEVEAREHRGRIDPRRSAVPTFDAWRIERLLPHAREDIGQIRRHLRGTDVAQRADGELDRALRYRTIRARRVEDVGTQDRAEGVRDIEAGQRIHARRRFDQFGLGIGIDEPFEQLAGEEALMDRLRYDDADRTVGIKVSGLPEKRFDAVVVLFGVEECLPVFERPAGKGTGALFDVGLGVVAQAQREEFHHFARVVFVGMRFGVEPIVEPHEHRRIARHRREQRAKISEALQAEERVLLLHHFGRRLAHGGCEMVVPEQRHFFDERTARAQHPIEPPHLHGGFPLTVLRGRQRAELHGIVRKGNIRGAGVEQCVDGAACIKGTECGDIRSAAAETGATEQMRGVTCAERAGKRRQGGCRIQRAGRAKTNLGVR